MAWCASTGGVTGEMIRDLMLGVYRDALRIGTAATRPMALGQRELLSSVQEDRLYDAASAG
jgi:hypothetical protein